MSVVLLAVAGAVAQEPVSAPVRPAIVETRVGLLVGRTQLPTRSDVNGWVTPSVAVNARLITRFKVDLWVGAEVGAEFGDLRSEPSLRARFLPRATFRIPVSETVHVDLGVGYALERTITWRAGGLGSVGLTSMWRGRRFGWWAEGRIGPAYRPGQRTHYVGGTGLNAGLLARW